jgi:hypothetical protein
MSGNTIDGLADFCAAFARDGCAVLRSAFEPSAFDRFHAEAMAVVRSIDRHVALTCGGDLDIAWAELARTDRRKASLLYDAVKYGLSLHQLAVSPRLIEGLTRAAAAEQLALVASTFRIDAPNEDHYSFSWHQDYWFSICSTRALVVWIPMRPIDLAEGGVELVSLQETGGKIFRVRRSPAYRSFSDSIILDEPFVPAAPVRYHISPGDALIFRFDVMHRSVPNRSSTGRCRWTCQLRFAAFDDPQFLAEGFRPGVVTKELITYLERERQ